MIIVYLQIAGQNTILAQLEIALADSWLSTAETDLILEKAALGSVIGLRRISSLGHSQTYLKSAHFDGHSMHNAEGAKSKLPPGILQNTVS